MTTMGTLIYESRFLQEECALWIGVGDGTGQCRAAA